MYRTCDVKCEFSPGKCSCREKKLKSVADLCKIKYAYGEALS